MRFSKKCHPEDQRSEGSLWRFFALCAQNDKIVGLIVLLVFTTSCTFKKTSFTKSLTLVYTSNVLGEFETCGCKINPIGGLARRKVLLDRLRAKGNPLLIVDSGDLFFKSVAIPNYLHDQSILQAEFLLKQLNNIGCDAIGLGETDFAMGLDFLLNLKNQAKFSFLNANIVDDKSGKNIFTPYVIKEVGEFKVGIFSVMEPFFVLPTHLKSLDPTEVSKKIVQELKDKKVDYIVALTHQGVDKDSLLVQNVSGIDIVVSGHDGARLEQPTQISNTLIVGAGDLGRHVGVLDLTLTKGIHVFSSSTQLQLEKEKITSKMTFIDEQINQLQKMKAQGQTNIDQQEKELLRQKWEISQTLDMAQPRVAQTKGNIFHHRMEALDEELGEGDPTIYHESQQLKEKIAKLSEQKQEISKEEPVKASGNHVEFATYRKCMECHKTQYESWKQSKHASAMLPLYVRNQHLNPECITCHSVGFQQPGGFTNLPHPFEASNGTYKSLEDFLKKLVDKNVKDLPQDLQTSLKTDPKIAEVFKKKDYKGIMIDLREHPKFDQWLRNEYIKSMEKENWKKDFMGIQCENCHSARGVMNAQGQSIPHFAQKQFSKKVVAQTCLQCHNSSQSPHFDFEKDKRIKGKPGAKFPFHCVFGVFE